jgi:hypothetical protein
VRRLLAVVSVAMLALRVAWVLAFREIDSDAYGHYFIAIATRNDPTNLAVHWVWLPLFHFVVGALTTVGLTFRGLRLTNAVLAAIGPVLLHRALRHRSGGAAVAWAEDPALLGATALALAPLTTILGQSAQPETLFSVLLVAVLYEGSRGHDAAAGAFLALACLVRYEAWGGALALAFGWALSRLRGLKAPPFLLVAIPSLVVGAYVVFRFWTDGTLLLFFRGTHAITTEQVGRTAWTFREIISFPIVLPFIVFGPALALVPLGWRAAFRGQGSLLPAGLAGFLLLSYYVGAAHAGERYLVSLVPFACAAIGFGIVDVGRRIRRPQLAAIVALSLLAATTGWHLRRAAKMAIAWDDGLREREAELERLAR